MPGMMPRFSRRARVRALVSEWIWAEMALPSMSRALDMSPTLVIRARYLKMLLGSIAQTAKIGPALAKKGQSSLPARHTTTFHRRNYGMVSIAVSPIMEIISIFPVMNGRRTLNRIALSRIFSGRPRGRGLVPGFGSVRSCRSACASFHQRATTTAAPDAIAGDLDRESRCGGTALASTAQWSGKW